jgi:RHS repeat-associated protein
MCLDNPRLVGDPVDVVTGVQTDASFDFRLPGTIPVAWNRFYSSARHLERLPLGLGHTHQYDHRLTLDLDGASYRGPSGEVVGFPDVEIGGRFAKGGLVLSRSSERDYDVTLASGDRLRFVGSYDGAAPLGQFARGDHALRFSYDREGHLVAILDVLGRSLAVTNDQDGRIIRIVLNTRSSANDELDRTLVTYQYDAYGRLVLVQDGYGFQQSFGYDERHLLTRRTDRKGYSFLFAYDEAGRCTNSKGEDGLYEVELRYDSVIKVTHVSKGKNPPFTYRYDDAGALTEIQDPYGATTSFLLDETGRTSQEVDPNGNVTTLHYDWTGRYAYRIDPNGHRLPATGREPEPGSPLETPLPQTALEWEFGQFVDPQAMQPLWSDDVILRGMPAAVIDAFLNRRESQYDGRTESEAASPVRFNDTGQPTEQVTASVSERWKYDPNGNEIEHQDRDGSLWKATFGSWNCLRERIDPLGHITSFENSASGLFTRIIDPGGACLEYDYDYNDRVVQVRRQGEVFERYVRDPAGNVIARMDARSLTTVEWEIGPGNVDRCRTLRSGERHEFEHDARGRVTGARAPSGSISLSYAENDLVVSDTRDGLGVVHELENGELAGTIHFDRFETNYFRGENGERVIVDPTGRTHRVRRGESGLIVKEIGNGTTELSQFDRGGRCLRKAMFRGSGSIPPRVTSFTYSRGGNLVEIAATSAGRITYAYDDAHRLIEEARAGQAARRFAFDKAGNLVAQPGLWGVRVDHANRIVEANGERLEYDHADRLISQTGPDRSRRYVYDELGMLVGAEIDGERWSAAYDPLGRRVSKVWQDRETTYYWDEFRLAGERRHDGSLRLYLYADAHSLVPFLFVEYSGPEADPRAGKLYAIFVNQVGVPTCVEDAEGQVCWAARVEPFGRVEIERGATIEMPLRYPGHYYDGETGLHYNRFRYFSPELGRYLQVDPAGQIGGINLFAYPVSPLIGVDLDGRGGKKTATATKSQSPPKPPKPCPYDLNNPENKALLEKPLDQMNEEELKKYAVLRAKQLQAQHVGDNPRADQGVTTGVTILTDKDGKILKDKDGNPVVLVTSSSERRTAPPGMELKPGEKFVSPEPHLVDRKVKDENGEPYMVPAGPKDSKGRVAVDHNGEPVGGYKEETQTVNKKTGEPYDRDTQSNHHAEQRGQTAVDDHNKGKSDDDKAKIGAIGPSRPCCEGCHKSLNDSGNLDKVDKDSQGSAPD